MLAVMSLFLGEDLQREMNEDGYEEGSPFTMEGAWIREIFLLSML